MDLYFAPLACSMAARIAIYESGQSAGFHEVTLSTKQIKGSGADYYAINPKGQVPALKTDEGYVMTEVAAVLQYIGDKAPDSGLTPKAGTLARYQVQQWLSFVGSELHKQIFYAIFNPASPPEVKHFARSLADSKYKLLTAHLADRDFLVDTFTIADAYLVITLNWCAPAGIDLTAYPVIQAYHQRLMARPHVGRAVGEELALRAAG